MNKRQIALYEYLLSKGDEWTTHAEIARELYEYYGNAECCLLPKDYHDTSERKAISVDCRELNTSCEVEKIIISSCKGVKIANETEFDRYIENQHKAILRRLSRLYKIAKKGGRHKQIDICGNSVEAFLEKNSENT